MKSRGSKVRFIKKPSTTFFSFQEPLSRERTLEPQREAEYKYKQEIPRKKGKGKFPKGTKF